MEITSIPKLAADLGISSQDYENIAKNVKRISLIPIEARQRILDRANSELPSELISNANSLLKNMVYDKLVYKIAGLSYAQGPPKGERIFTTAIADYLLRNK